ncbi:MAG: hypothetical protein ACC742_04585 [Thermoanaerobaculales bacterium]
MDRYDAILEHLKKAQSRGLDAVSSSLDSISASFEELIEAAKATVKEAAPGSPEECFPLSQIEAAINELRGQVAAPTGISLDLLRTLDRARSQSELLRELLPMLAEHVDRAVVLVIRDEKASAWSGIGFADGDRLRSWQGAVEDSPALQRMVESATSLSFAPADDSLFARWIAGDEAPEEGVLLPVYLRGKLMGAIYADRSGEEESWDIQAVQSLVAISCWLIDTLHHRQDFPTPMLAEIEAFEPAVAAPAVAEAPPGIESAQAETIEPELELETAEPVELASEPEPVAAPEPEAAFEAADAPSFEPEEASPEIEPESPSPEGVDIESPDDVTLPEEPGPAAADHDFDAPDEATEDEGSTPDFDPSATMRVDLSEMVIPPEASEEVQGPPAEAVAEVEAPPAAEVRPAPPPVQPVQPPEEVAPEPPAVEDSAAVQLSPEDEARHEEARRFARLLVSEIKLYNEDEVDRGRSGNDLYQRLQDDIDRSREMFEKRIPAEVRTDRDYFQEELVRILADGDDGALGM